MPVRIVTTIQETREALRERRRGSIGLVPTMGALHAGHGALIDRARAENSTAVASLFVNPIQFDRGGDLESYPRDLEADAAFCTARGVDLLFAPAASEMYPLPQRSFVEVTTLTERLCGRFRPGHFRGVATVVLKLFQIVQPDRAYFGEKDAQQLAVIRRMTADLNVPVRIVEVPVVREPDGLAMSSRNRLLSPAERAAAPELYGALREVARVIRAGERRADTALQAGVSALGRHPEFRLEYLEIVDPAELQPVEEIEGPVRIAAAAYLGLVRLIDTLLCRPSGTD
jgi:pantoate--beta-alanine ligase